MNPATFNSAAVREAGVPGCAMLGSARALANFYAALASGRTLGKNEALRRRLVADPTAGWLDDEPVQWGLGMQVGSIRSMNDELSSGVASPGVTTVLGHRGLEVGPRRARGGRFTRQERARPDQQQHKGRPPGQREPPRRVVHARVSASSTCSVCL
jgi:hypothetical protein